MGCVGSSQTQTKDGPNPLLTKDQQSRVKDIYEKQFAVNRKFMAHMGSIVLKAKRLANEARERNNTNRANSSDSSEFRPQSPETSVTLRPAKEILKYSDHSNEPQRRTREERISAGMTLIQQRLEHLQLLQVKMKDDGNCQFRAIAHHYYGDQEQHQKVRQMCVDHIKKQWEAEYSIFFDGESQGQAWLDSMSKAGTWGDEVTLRAICDALNITIHVLTSEESHYYVKYTPAAAASSSGQGGGSSSSSEGSGTTAASSSVMDVFLAYISPIHYNSVIVK
jgi:hypothetical protein